MVDVSNLTHFFDQLNKKYQIKIEYPTTHVTLYTIEKSQKSFTTAAVKSGTVTLCLRAISLVQTRLT
jgi:hypothetical protein